MNNTQKLKLARKYFIEQKKDEIWEIIKTLYPLWIIILFITITIIGTKYKEAIPILMGLSFGGLISITVYILHSWLSSNWQKAKEGAGLK